MYLVDWPHSLRAESDCEGGEGAKALPTLTDASCSLCCCKEGFTLDGMLAG